MKEEDIVLEEKPLVNGKMIDALEQVQKFNVQYIELLQSMLEDAKLEKQKLSNGK